MQIFLFEFKMGHKAAETTHNINHEFGPGTANKCTGQWWFKKFCKGDKSLEDEHSGRPLKVDNDQLRALSNLILLQLRKKLPKNSTLTILWSFSIGSKLERWKSSISGFLKSWLQIFKKLLFWSVIFFYSTQQQWAISQSDCDVQWKVDFIQQPVMTGSVIRPRRSFKAFPKAKLIPIKKKKGHGHGLVVCCWSVCFTRAFWTPTKALHLKSMLCEPMRCTENCNACIRHWSTKKTQFSLVTPDYMTHNDHFKSWIYWPMKFCIIHHTHQICRQPTITSSGILTTFCRENNSSISRIQKMLSNISSNPKAQIFTLQE